MARVVAKVYSFVKAIRLWLVQ